MIFWPIVAFFVTIAAFPIALVIVGAVADIVEVVILGNPPSVPLP